MKKIIGCLLCVIMTLTLISPTIGFAYNEPENSDYIILQIGNPVMNVNGLAVAIDVSEDTVPVVKDGRTLVPIRAIIESMGGTVSWDGSTSTVTLSYKGDIIKLIINCSTAFLNGTEKALDVAPVVINGRTMLPIRFIAENFGCKVDWDGTDSTIKINYSNKYVNPVRPTIKVGTNATLKPFEFYENGKVVGFDVDLIQLICDDLGYELEIVDMEFDALLTSLQLGKVDMVIATMTATEERKTVCDFTIPYLEIDTIFEGELEHDVFSIAVQKNNYIVNDINASIRKFQQDGTIDYLIQKWNIKNFNWDEIESLY